MESKLNYALVGFFIIVLASALVGTTLWLGLGRNVVDYQLYVAYIVESVSGLNTKAPVKYRGVDVGQVREISLDNDDPSRVRLLLEIVPDTPIKTDTVAALSSQGLTGIAFVELSGGSREAPALGRAGSQKYPVIRSGPSLLVRLDTAVSSLLREMTGAASEMRSVADHVKELLDAQNVAASAEILANVRRVTESLATHVTALAQTVEHINALSGNAAKVSGELPNVVTGLRQTLGAFQETANAISGAAAGVDKLATDARNELKGVTQGTIPEVARALQEVRELAETLNRLGQQLERDPSLILRGRSAQPPGPGE